MTEQTMAARLARILGDVGRVEKKGQIRSQGSGPTYNFARDADVLEAVNPKLADAGCVLVPEHTELLSMEPTMSGRQLIANIKTGWHVTDGKESLRFETFGQGADSGDKALPKAQSNARKYAFFMLFHIVTGDDPDQHASDQSERSAGGSPSSPRRTAPTSPRNKGEALALLAEVGHGHGLSFGQIEAKAKEMGVQRGTASVDDILRVVAAIEQPSGALASAAGDSGPSSTLPSDGHPDSSGSEAATDQPDQGGADRSSVQAGQAGSPPSGSQPAPTLDEVLEATGGELIPPKPGSSEYKALPAGIERAKARAFWDAQKAPEPEQESLAHALGAPEAD